jgi:hypothetical protein
MIYKWILAMHLLYVNYWLESTAITLFHDNTNLLKFSFKKN